MRVLESRRTLADCIERFDSHGAWSVKLGTGEGECHVYVVHFDSPGAIGPHEAGFDQLFFVVEGSGWVVGADGVRVSLEQGQAALFRRGEMHSKGSERGMTAIMVQVGELTAVPPDPAG